MTFALVGKLETTTKRRTRRGRRTRKKTKAAPAVVEETLDAVEETAEVVETEAAEVATLVEETVETEVAEVEEVVAEVTEEATEVAEVVEEAVAEAEAAVTAAVEDAPAEVEAETASDPDDLTKVWGIGPKFAGMLNDNGVTTFAQLAKIDLETLRGWIESSGIRQSIANEESWAEQAGFLAADDKKGHKAFIEKLKAEK